MTEDTRDNLEFLISQYVDGQLSARQARKFEQRLAADADLREQARLYGALEQGLRDLGAELPETDYSQQRAEIMGALERKLLLSAAPRRVFRPVFGVLAAAAALAVAVSVAAWIFRGPGPGPGGSPNRGAEGPSVQVTLQAQPGKGGQAKTVEVVFYSIEGQEIPPAPSYSIPEEGTPSGTILVSVGPDPEAPDEESLFYLLEEE